MFNWICPECGRDVSPSESECRFCAERKKAAQAAAPVVEQPSVKTWPPPPEPQTTQPRPDPTPMYRSEQPAYAPPSQQPSYPPTGAQQPAYTPPQAQPTPAPPYYTQPGYPPGGYPEPKRGLPTWAMSLLFALAFIGLGAAIFFGYQYFGKGPRAERAGVTEPSAAARSKPSNALQKYIEVVGIRLVQDAKHKPQAKFIVVNHSNAELNDLTANVTLWASTSRSEEDSVGTFSFKLGTIAGNESKEMTVPLTTKLKIYELPDWQNATADVQITQP